MKPKAVLRENVFLRSFLRRRRIAKWINDGYPLPLPSELKQEAVLYYAIGRKLNVLVETGTFMGDMVFAQEPFFKKIFSIELSRELFERAQRRFRNSAKIELLQGDSSIKLRQVVERLESPALFWLDGHYSGGITARGEKSCPIFAELTHIFSSSFEHVILIDDARLFNGIDDYPTIGDLNDFVAQNSRYEMRTENDMIVLMSPGPAA